MTRRPQFRLLPRITRNPLGWTYLRWGRALRRLDPMRRHPARWTGWAQDAAALTCILGAFHWLTLLGVALVGP